MIRRVQGRAEMPELMALLHPSIAEWFQHKFEDVTEAQAMAVPLIHAGRNVLVSSPTGSGKTLTAFLAILNELMLLAAQGRLEDRIYAVYVSPLKALANDINENLICPLAEISGRFREKGVEVPEVRVAVRTGDTLQSERQRHLRTPPHIFITTPESLSLVLSAPVFKKKFEQVDYVIVDEVHDVCDSKRGVALSLALERLREICGRDPVRIGLSATVAPVEEVAEFLVGLEGGKGRDVDIVEVFEQRSLSLEVMCPAQDMTALSFEVVNSKMYDQLKEMIDGHTTTLVFTNTRSGAESVVYKLKERGLEEIGTHHGSLSREIRLEVEDKLRKGALKSVVSSTSLELGIDIGSIDLVVQIGSPKSVAKGLQRIGRSGHQYRGTSKGRMLVFENDDLVECAVLCRAAHKKLIDRVTIPSDCLDVLAQAIVGLSIERQWSVDDAYELVRRSYCYRNLPRKQFMSVLDYLSGRAEFEGVYSKVWYNEGSDSFGKKRGSRMIYYLNQGTIPEESDYKVYSERGSLIGSLSEKFVERLSSGDIFVLGGRSYEFVRAKGTKAFVKSASGRKPTVPSWTGEMLPRSYDLSILVGQFREEMDNRLGVVSDRGLIDWLRNDFYMDEGSARTIVSYYKEQKKVAKLPTDSRLLIEEYVDESGNRSAIFHFAFGRRVNDALSRAYAHALSERTGANVTISVTDDSFMLTAPRQFEIEGLENAVNSANIEEVLRSAVTDSELFHQRFRHTAVRSFMVLRNYKGKELSVARQQLRSQRLLDALREMKDFPVMTETYSEILNEVMDLEHAKEVLRSIEDGVRAVEHLRFMGVPSPLAHNVILVGVSDIVLMEDRSMLLRELHRKVLTRVLGEDELSEYLFDTDHVVDYFSGKLPQVSSKEDILTALSAVGPMNLFREKGESIFARSEEEFDVLRRWAAELLNHGKVRSVWIGEDVYVTSEDWPLYQRLHKRSHTLSELESRILDGLGEEAMTVESLSLALHVDRADVRESVRRLEMANEVHRSSLRSNRIHYSRSGTDMSLGESECAVRAISRHLQYHAPLSLEDLAYEVGLPEKDVEQALRSLVSAEAVLPGRFVVGEHLQYMLAHDYLKLQALDKPAFDRDTIRRYSQQKHFAELPSIRSYFEKFGEAGSPYDISQRVPDFSMGEFSQMRDREEILLGRFLRGKLRYVLADDASYYLGAFREERLTKYESAILSALGKLGSGTFQEISEAANIPPDLMREHFDSLDRKGHLLRLYDGSEMWASRNVYAPCNIDPSGGESIEAVAERYLRGYGPATLPQVASYLDIEPEVARALMARIDTNQIIVGLEQAEMFLLSSELEALEKGVTRSDDEMRILSLYDPYLADRWTEIVSRFGEGWIHPVLYEGRIVGMIEKWLMAGAIDVREIHLDDMNGLGKLIDAMDRMMEFYRSMGVDVIRVRRAFGEPVEDLEEKVLGEFLGRGYELTNGMLVKGRIVARCYDRSEIVSAVFLLQHFEEADKLEDTRIALAAYGGLRSDAEALIRVKKFTPLSKLAQDGIVVKGHMVPDRVGYCLKEDAALYGAARGPYASDIDRLVMRIVRDQQPVKRERVLSISTVGPEATSESLKGLYLQSRVFMDGSRSYVAVPRSRRSSRHAWMQIARRLFRSYGVMTAESLSMLLGPEISMREVRSLLRDLEDEGELVKGYLMRGASTLYWTTPEVMEILGEAYPRAEVVVAPEDGLVTYLRAGYRDLLPETGRYAVYSGAELIGSFQARIQKSKLEVSDIQGDDRCRRAVERYARMTDRAFEVRDHSRVSEWEIIDFYRKSHPGL